MFQAINFAGKCGALSMEPKTWYTFCGGSQPSRTQCTAVLEDFSVSEQRTRILFAGTPCTQGKCLQTLFHKQQKCSDTYLSSFLLGGCPYSGGGARNG